MSSYDIEMANVSPVSSIVDNGADPAIDTPMVRRLFIVVLFGAVALAATWGGFTMEDRGIWPFTAKNAPVVIVID